MWIELIGYDGKTPECVNMDAVAQFAASGDSFTTVYFSNGNVHSFAVPYARLVELLSPVMRIRSTPTQPIPAAEAAGFKTLSHVPESTGKEN
jgi:hypothetical protein